MKTVLVTGANKGIGFETAKQLAQSGYYVYLGSRDKDKGMEAIERLNDAGITTVALLEIDVTNIDSIKIAKEELENKIEALDVLINNAGIAGLQPQNISICDMDNLRKVFDTNFFGAVQTTQQFLPLLKKSKQPIIVNVSSGLGSLTRQSTVQNPNFRLYDAYSLSKAALNAFTVLLANELGETNIKINSISPGYTATDLNQFKGTETVAQSAKSIVKFATLGKKGPTGRFFYIDEEIPW